MEQNQDQNPTATTSVVEIEKLFENLAKENEATPPTDDELSKQVLDDLVPKVEGEEKKVVVDPLKVEEKKVETKTEDNTATYNSVLQYIKDGVLEDVEVEIGEGDDLKTVKLSEFTDISPEELKNVIAGYKEALKQEAKESLYEGLDERTKKMIELKKAGGDINELIEAEIKYVNPLNDFDLEDEAHQERLVRMSLSSQGLRPKVIDATIEDLKNEVALDLEAKKIAEGITKQFDDYVEAQKTQQLEAIKVSKEEQKEFKKNLTTTLREYNLPENISKVILENSTAVDEYGLTNTDKLYFDSKKDPKVFAEISFMLNNAEEFKKYLGVKVKNTATINQVHKIIRVNTKNIKTEVAPPKTTEEEKEQKLKEFFDQNK